MAQSANEWGGGRNAYDSRPGVATTSFSERNFGLRENLGGGVCFPPPYYEYCNYDYSYVNLELYRLWALHTLWNSMEERDRPQPSYTFRPPEPPPPPAPPPTPVLHEYYWPEQMNTSATFSIVTNSGAVYLATMVWVEGGNVHFDLVDGGVLQVPLSSVSRSLTQTANAQKNLNLSLPSIEVAELTSGNGEAATTGATSKGSAYLRSEGN